MKYVKAEVETIVLENVDIITASPHPCKRQPGSYKCDYTSYTPCNITSRAYDGDCIWGIGICSKTAGPNSHDDPTETI